MSDAIIVALITLIGTIITVVVTSNNTQKELKAQNDVQNNELAHIKCDMTEMKADIKEHNHYAKMFTESQGKLNVIEEKISVANKRIGDLETFEHEVREKILEK